MKSYGVSRQTSAAPNVVWRVWSDPNNWSTWNSGVKEAKVDGPIANGTRGKMTTSRGSTHAVTFVDVLTGRGFSMAMAGPPLTTLRFSCSIEQKGGGSNVSQSVTFSGPLGFLFGAMMGAEMAKHFVPVLDDLARTAEAKQRDERQ